MPLGDQLPDSPIVPPEALLSSVRSDNDGAGDSEEFDFVPDVPRFDVAPPKPTDRAKSKASDAAAQQRKFQIDLDALKSTISQKLKHAGLHSNAATLDKCRTFQTIRRCRACDDVQRFWNRCEVFYCPCCQARLASDKRKTIEFWVKEMKQPKHVVLTCRNTKTLTPKHVKDFKAAFTKLRRRKFASNWKGGFYSLEVTNERKGWHLHLHALVEARWIDEIELAREFAKCLNQPIAIVKVKDAREKSYLGEVCKYAVKGTALASWSPEQVAEFVVAFSSQKTFGVFGTLYKERIKFRQMLDQIQADTKGCDCGQDCFHYFTEDEWEFYECTNGRTRDNAARTSKEVEDPTLALL